jgi:hypothetical protein
VGLVDGGFPRSVFSGLDAPQVEAFCFIILVQTCVALRETAQCQSLSDIWTFPQTFVKRFHQVFVLFAEVIQRLLQFVAFRIDGAISSMNIRKQEFGVWDVVNAQISSRVQQRIGK